MAALAVPMMIGGSLLQFEGNRQAGKAASGQGRSVQAGRRGAYSVCEHRVVIIAYRQVLVKRKDFRLLFARGEGKATPEIPRGVYPERSRGARNDNQRQPRGFLAGCRRPYGPRKAQARNDRLVACVCFLSLFAWSQNGVR